MSDLPRNWKKSQGYSEYVGNLFSCILSPERIIFLNAYLDTVKWGEMDTEVGMGEDL